RCMTNYTLTGLPKCRRKIRQPETQWSGNGSSPTNTLNNGTAWQKSSNRFSGCLKRKRKH
ncbi:hypothetical protein, partial [Kingella oralis]|uniref:hypothetical protein n=1 Tax=Kingella oralis TaxID=505 RepID=UPI003C6FAA94